jgi:hypothetical protein
MEHFDQHNSRIFQCIEAKPIINKNRILVSVIQYLQLGRLATGASAKTPWIKIGIQDRTYWYTEQHTQTSFLIISNRGRLPASGLGSGHHRTDTNLLF